MKGGYASDLCSKIQAAMTDDEKAEHESEYEELLALYIALWDACKRGDKKEALYDLAAKRCEFAIKHVLEGLDVDLELALQLVRGGSDGLAKHDKDLRARLIAAFNNLIEFSVCEEYQLYDELQDLIESGEIEYGSDEYEELIGLCRKYNGNYALVENGDIRYAGAIAAKWMRLSPADYVTYWTQNDSKVRPWHRELQGYTAHIDEFPSWMIPPIEWNCRCFLEVFEPGAMAHIDLRNDILAKAVEKPAEMDGVFEESLAKCGRIFGKSHPYFDIKEDDKEMLSEFVVRLKQGYYE